jgi:hypothetical protein
MENIVTDPGMTAFCGLYCGACGSRLKGRCAGCAANEKATWCKPRACCITKKIKSCADCTDFKDVKECKKFNNVISKLMGLVFRSDRAACIRMIRERGYEGYARYMADNRIQTIKR